MGLVLTTGVLKTGTQITGIETYLGAGAPYSYAWNNATSPMFDSLYALGSSIIGWTFYTTSNPGSPVTITSIDPLGTFSLGFSGDPGAGPYTAQSPDYSIKSQGFSIGPGVVLVSNPTFTLVTTNLLFNLDMQNYQAPSGWNDNSGNNYTFTFSGTPTVVNQGTNQAYWDNTSNTLRADPTGGAILPAGSYTKCAMIWSNGTNGTGNILSSGTAQDVFWTNGGQTLHAGHNGNWATVVGNIPIPVGEWTFVAVTFDTTNGWTLYQNGVNIGTNPDTTIFQYGPSAPEIGGFDYGNVFTGKIAAAQEYTRALTQLEIQQNYVYYRARYNGVTPT